MGILLNWLNEDQEAIYWEFEPDWTIEEFYRAFDRCLEMADNGPFTVIADMQHVYSMSSNALSIFIMRHATLPANYQGSIVFNASHYMQRLFALMNRQPFTRDRFTIVASLDEALLCLDENCKSIV
jgi:hypothetical protein